MPAWVDDLLQPERLITVALVLFLLWLLIKSLIAAWPFLSQLVALVETLVGDADNPGIGDRMEAQGKKLADMGELLESVRAQVQNSHDTNLRDDVDDLQTTVSLVHKKLDEHIAIAKESDRRQDKTAEEVAIMRRDIGRIVAKYVP